MSLDLAAEPVPLYWAEERQVIRVEGTRISIDCVVYLFVEEGKSAAEIVEEYPSLGLEKVHAVIAYYLRHKPDLDAYLDDRRRSADETRRIVESSPDPRTAAARIASHFEARRARR